MHKIIIASCLLSAVALPAIAADEAASREKCYGVAKAAKNDCASKDGKHSCAGQSTRDSDPNEWVYAPKGLCEKLSGGVKG